MYGKLFFKIIIVGIMTVIQAACENARNEVVENLIYINEASTAKTKELTLLEGTTRTSLTIRLAKATMQDIKVELFLNKAFLDKYNKKNETNYRMPEETYVSFPKNVTIEAGRVSAEPINIDIEEFETEGAQYAVPVGIKSVEGDTDKAESSSDFMLVLVKPLKQQVPKFRWYNGMQADPQVNWGMSLPNYTLEWWSKISDNQGGGFTKNNQAIINSGGGDVELYIRFGDEIYASGGSYVYNFLQIKTFGSQFDSGNPTAGKGLEANKWYHFALTYDAATGTSLLYQNGTPVASLSTSPGKPMMIDKFQMISSGSPYFLDFCEMCQVRLWKVTRSASQIRKSMYSEVEYTNKDLILYYPMNEGEGATILHDVTGNGHNIEIGNLFSSNTNHAKVTWETYLFAQ